MEENPTTQSFDAFEEASKALLDLVLGTDLTNQLIQNMESYSHLIEENEKLRAEVASLKEKPPFKDKYENLKQEFQKVASERDSLSAQALETSRIKNQFEKCKSAYQSMKGQLAALQKNIEEGKSSISESSALECLYQSFKSYCEKCGYDVRRIPTLVAMQFQLQDGKNTGVYWEFSRTSATNWKRIK